MYPERDLNPHEHYCSLDFKSNVSTNSTTSAWTLKSERRDLNPRPSPWQGDALPLSYFRNWKANVRQFSQKLQVLFLPQLLTQTVELHQSIHRGQMVNIQIHYLIPNFFKQWVIHLKKVQLHFIIFFRLFCATTCF